MSTKKSLKRALAVAHEFGIDPRKTLASARRLPSFIGEYRHYAHAFGSDYEVVLRPTLRDASVTNGSTSGHYFNQDLHVAQRVFENNPKTHFDVGSRIDGFVAHLASFRTVHVLDVRPNSSEIPNVTFHVSDICAELDPQLVASSDSVSCLHALEHFGLGRYGDPIDPVAYKRGFDNLAKILEDGGRMYLSVPVSSRPRIEFNAHRVFSLPKLLELFDHGFEVVSVAYIDDAGAMHSEIDWNSADAEQSFSLDYGCAIVEAIKH